MARCGFRRLRAWLLEVEMGFVWGVAGTAMIVFVFASIWFIDPALLTLVLQFRQAVCTTENSAILVGISNCSWTSCRVGCTRDVYKCWQVQVSYEFVEGAKPYAPPWKSISDLEFRKEKSDPGAPNTAKLYPNVKGCGYPPDLNCDEFFKEFGPQGQSFDCWVSTLDGEIAMTELNLDKAKSDVVFSLVPLMVFIVSVLYAFCRLGVFSVCNPLRCCPKANDTKLVLPALTPKQLFNYKKDLVRARKEQAQSQFSEEPDRDDDGDPGGGGPDATQPLAANPAGLSIPDTIEENSDEKASKSPTPPRAKSSAGSIASSTYSPLGILQSPSPPQSAVARNRLANRISPASPTFSSFGNTPLGSSLGLREAFVATAPSAIPTGPSHQRAVGVSGGGNNSYIIGGGRSSGESSTGATTRRITVTPSPPAASSSASASLPKSSSLQFRKKSISGGSASKKQQRRFEQEVLDMSDFDFELAALEDDVASIRSMRTALAGHGGHTYSGSELADPTSPRETSALTWTRNEAVSPWSSNTYSGNRKKTK